MTMDEVPEKKYFFGSKDLTQEILSYLGIADLQQCRLLNHFICEIIEKSFVRFVANFENPNVRQLAFPQKITDLIICRSDGNQVVLPSLKVESLSIFLDPPEGAGNSGRPRSINSSPPVIDPSTWKNLISFQLAYPRARGIEWLDPLWADAKKLESLQLLAPEYLKARLPMHLTHLDISKITLAVGYQLENLFNLKTLAVQTQPRIFPPNLTSLDWRVSSQIFDSTNLSRLNLQHLSIDMLCDPVECIPKEIPKTVTSLIFHQAGRFNSPKDVFKIALPKLRNLKIDVNCIVQFEEPAFQLETLDLKCASTRGISWKSVRNLTLNIPTISSKDQIEQELKNMLHDVPADWQCQQVSLLAPAGDITLETLRILPPSFKLKVDVEILRAQESENCAESFSPILRQIIFAGNWPLELVPLHIPIETNRHQSPRKSLMKKGPFYVPPRTRHQSHWRR
eukprot:TRINITY_DN4196_c0_g1_i2.p1 TRINITY_DN4196_c0_g1~~TRINITY_DN4196_c0_g1_i2.p1  ORF type:complete len:453 (-),score=120.77 TRINITY_DN4196_c0_g1_i2:12-1370(-)